MFVHPDPSKLAESQEAHIEAALASEILHDTLVRLNLEGTKEVWQRMTKVSSFRLLRANQPTRHTSPGAAI